ncbi:hypothetical protein [Dyella sp. ASV21]|uniref:hypothetical protein n=1 Tax=Dyella sp. ASV21 TaxID=2795114 RepID=UPI0018ED4055|nr:hypothetical protein [Dyella sp. ASV21]
MNKLIALFYVLLSFAGCEQGRTVVVQSSVDGRDVLYSKVHVNGSQADFQCIRSQSGECHYSLVNNDCAPASIACTEPLAHFTVPVGNTRHMTSLPAGFQSCVTPTPTPDDRCVALASDPPPENWAIVK